MSNIISNEILTPENKDSLANAAKQLASLQEMASSINDPIPPATNVETNNILSGLGLKAVGRDNNKAKTAEHIELEKTFRRLVPKYKAAKKENQTLQLECKKQQEKSSEQDNLITQLQEEAIELKSNIETRANTIVTKDTELLQKSTTIEEQSKFIEKQNEIINGMGGLEILIEGFKKASEKSQRLERAFVEYHSAVSGISKEEASLTIEQIAEGTPFEAPTQEQEAAKKEETIKQLTSEFDISFNDSLLNETNTSYSEMNELDMSNLLNGVSDEEEETKERTYADRVTRSRSASPIQK